MRSRGDISSDRLGPNIYTCSYLHDYFISVLTSNPSSSPTRHRRKVRKTFAQFDPRTPATHHLFEKAVLHNGGSTAPRGNLVDKELALMALIKKAARSK
jgi:hypothetical protein